MSEPRICQGNGCSTRLSAYNKGRYCSSCERYDLSAKTRGGTIPPRRGKTREKGESFVAQ